MRALPPIIIIHRGGGRDQNRGDDQHHHHNNKPRHRGFGYVQVETLEQLQGLMQLNEKEGVLVAGRRIQLDTANAPRQRHTENSQLDDCEY